MLPNPCASLAISPNFLHYIDLIYPFIADAWMIRNHQVHELLSNSKLTWWDTWFIQSTIINIKTRVGARSRSRAHTRKHTHTPTSSGGGEWGWVTGIETEGPVFTLAGRAAREPCGNGRLTSKRANAPPWLTGSAGLWAPTQSAPCISQHASLPRAATPNETSHRSWKENGCHTRRRVAGATQWGHNESSSDRL